MYNYYMYIYVHFRPLKSVVITSYKDSIVAIIHVHIQTAEYNNFSTPDMINL